VVPLARDGDMDKFHGHDKAYNKEIVKTKKINLGLQLQFQ
jgi:hypothetical protein